MVLIIQAIEEFLFAHLSFIIFSLSSRNKSYFHQLPFCLRIIYAIHGENTETERRVSSCLGVDSASHIRKCIPVLSSTDAQLPTKACFSVPGIKHEHGETHTTQEKVLNQKEE